MKIAVPIASADCGVCRVCGCTDEHGCAEGCEWVDASHTLCSECYGQGHGLRGLHKIVKELAAAPPIAVDVDPVGLLFAAIGLANLDPEMCDVDAADMQRAAAALRDIRDTFSRRGHAAAAKLVAAMIPSLET